MKRTRHVRRLAISLAIVVALLGAWIAVIALVSPVRWRIYWEGIRNNTAIDFYGKVVDADGRPVAGAVVHARLNRHGLLYLFGGKPVTTRKFEVTTDAEGKFSLQNLNGYGIWFKRIDKEGYQWLYGTLSQTDDNISFAYRPTGPSYVPNPDRPAIFPLVRPGEVASALPSRGGWYRDWDGSKRPNAPVVPYAPSVPGAVVKPKR
jgi:hypothetical protein